MSWAICSPNALLCLQGSACSNDINMLLCLQGSACSNDIDMLLCLQGSACSNDIGMLLCLQGSACSNDIDMLLCAPSFICEPDGPRPPSCSPAMELQQPSALMKQVLQRLHSQGAITSDMRPHEFDPSKHSGE